MSIASKINVQRADAKNWQNEFLFEPENAEMKVSVIAGAQLGEPPSSPLNVFAETLSAIREGIEAGQVKQTLATIDLLVELAYLESADYNSALERFRAKVEGRLKPDGEIEPRTTTSASEAEQEAT